MTSLFWSQHVQEDICKMPWVENDLHYATKTPIVNITLCQIRQLLWIEGVSMSMGVRRCGWGWGWGGATLTLAHELDSILPEEFVRYLPALQAVHFAEPLGEKDPAEHWKPGNQVIRQDLLEHRERIVFIIHLTTTCHLRSLIQSTEKQSIVWLTINDGVHCYDYYIVSSMMVHCFKPCVIKNILSLATILMLEIVQITCMQDEPSAGTYVPPGHIDG